MDSLKKENISIEASTEDLADIVEKVNILKNKIEKEINNINSLYDKAIEDLTKDFNEKIENLIKAEKEIKEKLKNVVTKTKEKFENTLIEIYRLINMNENINKGIKKIDKDEKNTFRFLSYISKISENKKNMNTLLKQPLISIKFSYLTEKCDINYDEFYINGGKYLKKIEDEINEMNYGENIWGRILFDTYKGKVYYIDGCNNNKINE